MFDRLLCDVVGPEPWGEQLAENALEEAILLIAHAHNRSVRRVADPCVAQVIHELNRHYREPLTVADLAATVHLSPSRLAHLFQEATGEAPIQMLLLASRVGDVQCGDMRSVVIQSGHPSYGRRALNVSYLGELAALGTATLWSVSSIFFAIGSRRVGSMIVNRIRLALAVLFVGAMHWLLFGRPFPVEAELYRYGWLGLSALIGLVLGDGLLFQCYVLVGPRIGVLLLSLSPVFSTALAWIFLGERLTPVELVAMAIALGGVAWVVLERGRRQVTQAGSNRDYALGIAFGLGAAFCQSANLVIAKQGLGGGFPALSGTMIRMSIAVVAIWAWATVLGEAGRTIRKVCADGQATRALLGGAFAGPFLGVWLSMIAIQSARIGIASTLMAMTPVLSLPLVRIVFQERVTARAVIGTLTAMTGVAAMILL